MHSRTLPKIDDARQAGARSARSGSEDAPRALLGSAQNLDGRGSAPQGLGISTVITDDFRPARPLIETVDQDTGEIRCWEQSKGGHRQAYDADAAHMERWIMLRHAQEILGSFEGAFELRDKTDRLEYCAWSPDFVGPRGLFEATRYTIGDRLDGEGNQVQHLEPVFRTVNCLCRRVGGKDAEVFQSRKSGQCSWHNLTVCGSPWTCAVCSRRINLTRQDQIKATYEAFLGEHVQAGVYMLTFTVKHGRGDDAEQLVDAMKDAMQLVQKTGAWKRVTRRKALKRDPAGYLGYVGRIAALEVTHGANGWHPHEHHLWFFERKLSSVELQMLRSDLFSAWHKCCLAAGLEPPVESITVRGKTHYVGLDVREAMSAAEYLAKCTSIGIDRAQRFWGPEKEIASSHVKAARSKGRTPMQILADSVLRDAPEGAGALLSWNADARLFLAFSQAFKGRHQLQFSRTLKAWLAARGIAIDESAAGDLEAAASLEEDADFQFEVDKDDWMRIVRNRAQGVVLAITRASGSQAALDYIAGLPGRLVDVRDSGAWCDTSAMQKRSPQLLEARYRARLR